MKLIKLFILASILLMSGAKLYADVGLKDDSLVEIKPKTCDFQWWKGSTKNYNAAVTTDKTADKNTGTTEK